ncbi:histidine kinase [uncultured Kordia sp.]|uniref:sensor histidine kinase n=1 Tax=uncultured Kordia sp. TaxID=507699 RepID=UPI0026184031|nr:histidine kinase [uncultured Kordia sp.]
MLSFFKKYYNSLAKGGIIAILLGIVLYRVGVVMIYPDFISGPIYVIVHIVILILYWLTLSFLIHKFSVYKILGVLSLLIVGIIAEQYMGGFNPISIPILIIFWLAVMYLIVPDFFKKYQKIILPLYGFVLLYFLIFRMLPNYAETYHQNFIYFILFPIPFFFVLWMYEQWKWLQTLQADKAKAELMLLKSQVNPHFFFNTLNNLYGLVVEQSEKAPEVVLKLSDMMRYTIDKGKEDVVLLKDEISYLENYIELHKIRYQKKVDIVFTHDVEENLQVTPLLFIILLENAFKHGIETLREHAFIHLNMESKDKQLFFSIENNFNEIITNDRQGIGLENLKQRLQFSYSNTHKLRIEKKATLYTVQLNIDLT